MLPSEWLNTIESFPGLGDGINLRLGPARELTAGFTFSIGNFDLGGGTPQKWLKHGHDWVPYEMPQGRRSMNDKRPWRQW